MTHETPTPCAEIRPLLRGHALNTLDEAQHARVEAHLRSCPACGAASGGEREALALLADLPPVETPEGLAERTLSRVRSGEDRKQRLRQSGLFAAVAVLVTVVLLAAVLGSISVPRMRANQRELMALSNLKRLAMAFKMYSNESQGGQWPPVAPYPGIWAPDLSALYPSYLDDPALLVDPTLPNAPALRRELKAALEQSPPDYEQAARIAAQSYVYTGHALTKEEDLTQFLAERTHIAAAAPGSFGRTPPLKEGIERFFLTDINNAAATSAAQAAIPVLFQTPRPGKELHSPVHVLFMDGHTATLPYGAAFPALPSVLEQFPPPLLKEAE